MNLRLLACFICLLCRSVANGQTPEGWPDLSKPAPVQGGGEKDVALIIGISDYDKLADISGSADNAKDWAKYFIETRKLAPENVFLVTDGNATREEMLRKLDSLVEASKAGGTLWFVYIGHGYSAGEDYLVGVDADVNNVTSRSLMQSELFEKLSKGNQTNTNVILDASFNTGTTTKRSSSEERFLVTPPPLPPKLTSTIKKIKPNNLLLLTATVEGQSAGPLPNASRPAFSYLVLGAMRGWASNDDNNVTAQEAVDYAAGVLRQVSDRKQTPQLQGPGAQVLSTASETEPDPSAARLPVAAPTDNAQGKSVKLRISSEPGNARVYFNNLLVGVTPFDAPALQSEKSITILFEKEGFVSTTEVVVPDQDRELNVVLAIDAAPTRQDAQLGTPLQRIAPTGLMLLGAGSGVVSVSFDSQFCQDPTVTSNVQRVGAPVFAAASGVSLGGLWLALKGEEAPRLPSLLAGAGTASAVATGLLLFRPICGNLRDDFGEDPLLARTRFPVLRTASIVGFGLASVASFSAAIIVQKRPKEAKQANLSFVPSPKGSTISLSVSW